MKKKPNNEEIKDEESLEVSDFLSSENDDEDLLYPESRKNIPKLNLEKAGADESTFTLKLHLSQGLSYSA